MEENNKTNENTHAAQAQKPNRRRNHHTGAQKKTQQPAADGSRQSKPAKSPNPVYQENAGGKNRGRQSAANRSGESKNGDRKPRGDRQNGDRPGNDRQNGGRTGERHDARGGRRPRGRGGFREAPLPEDIKMRHNDYVANYEADEELLDNRYCAEAEEQTEDSGAVIGRNAVRELLKSDRSIDKILVRRGDREGSIVVLVAEAVSRGIPVIEVEKAKLDSLAGFAPHQGIVAMAAAKEYSSVDDILEIARARGEKPLIVIADGIVDPYNLGSLIRCAEGVGAHGLIIPKRRAVGLTPLVTKASAGAIEHLAIAKVANIAQTVEYLKKQGVWTYAAEAGGKSYHDTDFRGPCAIIFGSEGGGVSSLLLEKCDFVTSIPMYGKVNSFNVSTAAAVILAEASRQQRVN